jgi:UDP-N-acetylmuramyl pentapeptide phosphotransferase/UDP-N-acetylglucosamine-1-phosphate transferase
LIMPLPNSSPLSAALIAVLIVLAACALCAAILGFLLKSGLAWRLATDVPNERSLHTRPTPRVGGWGVVPVVVLAILLLAPSLWLIALGVLFLAAVSQIDDRRGLPARVRFAAHLVAVAALIALYPAATAWWCLAGLAFLLLWLVNLYNFMDGADGLAGGMALFGFGAYAVAALFGPAPIPELGWACAAVAGAAAGFLLFNFHPAKVFLGDAGSIPAGFLAGALGYWGWRQGVWPIWFPALVFSPFIGDASVTLLRRLLRGEKFWQAHREHYYQRMVRIGTGHAATAVIWYLVMLAGTVLAVLALGRSPGVQWGIVAGWAVVLVLLGATIDARWRNFQAVGRKTEVDADVPQ